MIEPREVIFVVPRLYMLYIYLTSSCLSSNLLRDRACTIAQKHTNMHLGYAMRTHIEFELRKVKKKFLILVHFRLLFPNHMR